MSKNQPIAIASHAHAEQKGWRRNQDLVDALPYIDTLSPEEKQRVDALIEEEVGFYFKYGTVSALGLSIKSFTSLYTSHPADASKR